MRRLATRITMVVLAGLLLSSAAAEARHSAGWSSYTDPTWHIRVSIPASWHIVPPSVAGVRSLAKQLVAKNNAGLAAVYTGLVSTQKARQQLLGYHFQAFEYVPKATQQPDFALAFARTTASIARNPAEIADSFATTYASEPETVVTRHAVVALPAGRAAFVEGTQRGPTGNVEEFEEYILGRGTLLWQLSFRSDALVPGALTAFSGIADRFAFT